MSLRLVHSSRPLFSARRRRDVSDSEGRCFAEVDASLAVGERMSCGGEGAMR